MAAEADGGVGVSEAEGGEKRCTYVMDWTRSRESVRLFNCVFTAVQPPWSYHAGDLCCGCTHTRGCLCSLPWSFLTWVSSPPPFFVVRCTAVPQWYHTPNGPEYCLFWCRGKSRQCRMSAGASVASRSSVASVWFFHPTTSAAAAAVAAAAAAAAVARMMLLVGTLVQRISLRVKRTR